jgi:hypothetical protein
MKCLNACIVKLEAADYDEVVTVQPVLVEVHNLHENITIFSYQICDERRAVSMQKLTSLEMQPVYVLVCSEQLSKIRNINSSKR